MYSFSEIKPKAYVVNNICFSGRPSFDRNDSAKKQKYLLDFGKDTMREVCTKRVLNNS